MSHTGPEMDPGDVLEAPETTGLLSVFGAFHAAGLLRAADFDAFRGAVRRAAEAGDGPVDTADMLLNETILACAVREHTAAVDNGVPAASFSRLGKRSAAAVATAGAGAGGDGRPAQRQRTINGGAS